MNIGMILLAWFLIAVVTVAALLGSGVVSVRIEKGDEEEDAKDDDERS